MNRRSLILFVMCWLFLLLSLTVLIWVKIRWDHQYASAVTHYETSKADHHAQQLLIMNQWNRSSLSGQSFDTLVSTLSLDPVPRLYPGEEGTVASRTDWVPYLEGSKIRLGFDDRGVLISTWWREAQFKSAYPAHPQEELRNNLRLAADTIAGSPFAMMVLIAMLAFYAGIKAMRGWMVLMITAWLAFCTTALIATSYSPLLSADIVADQRLWWVVAMAATILVFVILMRYFRPRDPLACRGCNYNLKGNQSGNCPECGAALLPSQFNRVRREKS